MHCRWSAGWWMCCTVLCCTVDGLRAGGCALYVLSVQEMILNSLSSKAFEYIGIICSQTVAAVQQHSTAQHSTAQPCMYVCMAVAL